MYGRAFRNPSTFERYYTPNPDLAAERIDTLEFAREQKLWQRLNVIVSAYQYRLRGLIVGEPAGDGFLQYQNGPGVRSTGIEAEVNGRPTGWLEMSASFSAERTRNNDSSQLQNSPPRMAQFRASVPLARQRLLLAGGVRYLGPRMTAYGDSLNGVALADVTLTATRINPHFDLQFGVRNLFNTSYADPLSTEHATRLMPGAGRSLYVRMVWRQE
jgi:outer membrane receptor protein involved in Fe transport